MKTLFVTSKDSTRIAYDVTGEGPPLMLLHGVGQTRHDWHVAGYVQRLKKDFAVITVDIRGMGESDERFDVGDYAVESICADLTLVADACRAERFSVWGFSFGGNIARYLGAWTNRVSALAIIGIPFGRAVDEKFDAYIAELEQKWGPAVRDYHNGKLDEKERREIQKRQLAVLLPCFQAMRNWPSIEPADLHCPTLLLVGTKNKNAMDWVKAHHEMLEKAKTRIEICEGLSHNQEFAKIDRVFPSVSTFLKSTGSS